MTRILIIGSRGRLGSMLVRHFKTTDGVASAGLDRHGLDLARPDRFAVALEAMEFDVLINTAALTSVDLCESEPELAKIVNAEAPEALAAICRERGARMAQVSTDYVFSGVEPGLRSESDPVEPLGAYGHTKASGETAVLDAGPRNLVLRTSWVFGPGRPSFPDMILERARSGVALEAIADKWSCPTLNADFAGWLESLLRVPAASGVFHLCNAGACSWHEYAEEVLRLARDAGHTWADCAVKPITLAEMTRFTAPRPVHTALSTARLHEATGLTPRPWQQALGEYVRGLNLA